jgi:hypothetical protein
LNEIITKDQQPINCITTVLVQLYECTQAQAVTDKTATVKKTTVKKKYDNA